MKLSITATSLFISCLMFSPSAFSQSEEDCADALTKISKDVDANMCFKEQANWDKITPGCTGYTQTMVEMANEAYAEMDINEDPIAPVHGNSDEDNEMMALESVTACLEAEQNDGGDGSACIGQVSDKCLEADDDYSTLAMRKCISLEHSAWDNLLNADYKRLMESLDTNAKKTKLRDAQRLWIKFSGKFCALGYEFNQGAMYLLSGDQCMMDMTARQDLALRQLTGPRN